VIAVIKGFGKKSRDQFAERRTTVITVIQGFSKSSQYQFAEARITVKMLHKETAKVVKISLQIRE
jgi:hypothetical protein